MVFTARRPLIIKENQIVDGIMSLIKKKWNTDWNLQAFSKNDTVILPGDTTRPFPIAVNGFVELKFLDLKIFLFVVFF